MFLRNWVLKGKKIWRNHRKTIVILLLLFILSRIFLATHYVAKSNFLGHWKVVYHKDWIDNPCHEWEGTIYYYGWKSPDKVYIKTHIDGRSDDDYEETDGYVFWDHHTDDYGNIDRILLNVMAPSLPSFAAYSFLDMGDRLKKMSVDIKWERDGKTYYETVKVK